ncbi:zinc ribbon domain-containing protein [Paraburkholderia sp.]|uniref:zinc ribbon domain-containing protein n=1 Tax=Paraburkholderia sp. TaxID=1926495 RepID=UPI003D6FC4BE
MPMYDYECANCGTFETMRKIAERDAPVDCPRCGAAVERIHTGTPMLATAGGDGDSEGSYGMRHRAGCSCC